MKLLSVQVKMSTSNHPQSDGQNEEMNRIVEKYLRMFCSHEQTDWDQHVAKAEFAYSSSVFDASGLTPFVMDLGWEFAARNSSGGQSIRQRTQNDSQRNTY